MKENLSKQTCLNQAAHKLAWSSVKLKQFYLGTAAMVSDWLRM